MSNFTASLPNGEDFLFKVVYTRSQASGVLVLIITSGISAIAVFGLLFAIALSAWNTRKSVNPHMFVRTHAAAYLISLLLCDLTQAIGSLMNAKWLMENGVEYGAACTVQGVFKQVADVGSAIWALVIAVHTFWVLFLRWDLRRYVLIATLVFGWSIIGAIVFAGPATVDVVKNGPFYAIAGYWCWISDQHQSQRITLDYMFMFLSALLSFIIYALIFLKLRGNILVDGFRVRVRVHRESTHGVESVDSQIISVAKSMMLYPVIYTVTILPIAVCRFTAWSTNHEVPFGATIFSDTIFLLAGIANVVLFTTTRRVLPPHSVIPARLSWRSSMQTAVGSSGTSDTVTIDSDSTYDAEKGIQYGDDNMFKRVGSPDSDDSASDIGLPVQSVPTSPSPTGYTHDHAAGEGRSLPPGLAPERFEHISLDGGSVYGDGGFEASHYYAHSPVTAPGPRGSLRSPVTAPRFGTPQTRSFRDSTGRF